MKVEKVESPYDSYKKYKNDYQSTITISSSEYTNLYQTFTNADFNSFIYDDNWNTYSNHSFSYLSSEEITLMSRISDNIKKINKEYQCDMDYDCQNCIHKVCKEKIDRDDVTDMLQHLYNVLYNKQIPTPYASNSITTGIIGEKQDGTEQEQSETTDQESLNF